MSRACIRLPARLGIESTRLNRTDRRGERELPSRVSQRGLNSASQRLFGSWLVQQPFPHAFEECNIICL
jgi:hypothetical protein